MLTSAGGRTLPPRPLRLWPGVAIVALQWLARFVVPVFEPGAMTVGMAAGLLGGPAVLVWWAFFSRAPRSERWGAVLLMIVALVLTPRILDESIATGNMGTQFFIYVIPVLSLAFVVWAVVSRHLPDGARRATMVATILVACGVWALLRSDGITGDGRVYTLGATGIVNALDAFDGSVVWSRNAASDTGAKAPEWGFASSPLVVDDVVIVAVSGRLVAYDGATGDLRWTGPDGGESYGSPHLLTIDGVAQVLLLSETGTTSVAPADGTLLWEHPVGSPILQPARIAAGELLISDVEMMPRGMRRLSVAHGPGGWAVEERWKSAGLKPHFNDFVVHEGHAFGFDGSILACIDLEDGERRWKGGRYGNGQLILLPDQDLLLVVSERGELALVGAIADRFTELARFPAIEGKTWNHPVLAGDVLLVRNSREMAAFRLEDEVELLHGLDGSVSEMTPFVVLQAKLR